MVSLAVLVAVMGVEFPDIVPNIAENADTTNGILLLPVDTEGATASDRGGWSNPCM